MPIDLFIGSSVFYRGITLGRRSARYALSGMAGCESPRRDTLGTLGGAVDDARRAHKVNVGTNHRAARPHFMEAYEHGCTEI